MGQKVNHLHPKDHAFYGKKEIKSLLHIVELPEHCMRNLHFLDVGGKKIETAHYGPGPDKAPTLVFLHEGLGCVDMWHDFPKALSDATGCGVLVYSRLGYGRSDPCRLPRSIRFMHIEGMTVLPKVLKQANVKDHILIGHSDGGSIALIHAGANPCDGLKGVATLAAHVFCEPVTISSIQKAKQRFYEKDLRKRLEKYHGRNTDCAFHAWNGPWLDPDFMNWNIVKYLPHINVPVLAIQGEDDQYGTLSQVDAIRRHCRDTIARTKILPHCGHSPYREKPDQTLQLLTAFIRPLM